MDDSAVRRTAKPLIRSSATFSPPARGEGMMRAH